MATRSRLRKGDDAKITLPPDSDIADKDTQKADGDMSDDGKKPWEVDSADKSEDDDDAGEDIETDGASKAEGDEDDDDDDDGGKPATQKSRHARFRADLNKAINFLARHGELHDPALRKEALMAKDLKGGGLNKSERAELVGLLQGTGGLNLADQTARSQAPGPGLRKSMVDNAAMGEAYDNVTRTLHHQARYVDHMAKSLEQTSFAMARALAATSDTVAAVYDRQEQLGEAVDRLASQPAQGPRSVGLGWVDKSFSGEGGGPPTGAGRGGRLEKASPNRLRSALQEMAKSAGARSAAGAAYRLAADGLLMRRPMPPSVAAAVEQHLNDTAS